MTIDAEIVVLFAAPPSEVVAPGVMGFSMIDDADLHCFVSPDGQFDYRSDARMSPLLGEPSLERRLWLGTLGRLWSPDLSEYGGRPDIYAKTLRSMAKMPGVVYVWSGVLTHDSGCCDVPAVTDNWISSFFGDDVLIAAEVCSAIQP